VETERYMILHSSDDDEVENLLSKVLKLSRPGPFGTL
jgi:hypothetical protein